MPHRSVELDYGRAFLDKHIAPGQYRNLEPVGYYSRYLEHNQARVVTLGAKLWDSAMQVQIDRDYSRGFLENDVAPGEAAMVVVRMRAPVSPASTHSASTWCANTSAGLRMSGRGPEITKLIAVTEDDSHDKRGGR